MAGIFLNLFSHDNWKWLLENCDDHIGVLVITISLIIVTTFFSFKRYANKSGYALPPGPMGLPIVGNLLFLDPELHSHFAELGGQYGPILTLRLGRKLGVVVNSPSVAREILKDHDVTFANRENTTAGRVGTYGGADIVSAQYGATWRMLRRVCVREMLSSATLDSVYGLRRAEIRKMVRNLDIRVGSCVDVGEQEFLTTLNVIMGMLWGGTVKGEERESLGTEFRKLVGEMTKLLAKPNLSDFFPVLAWFDLQGIEGKMESLAKRCDRIFVSTIDQRLRMEAGGEGSTKDFVHVLLKLRDEEDSKTPLTMTHVKALLMDMVVGGTETSSNTIEFALAEMMNKPQVMQKAQQELDAVVGKNSMVEESHVPQLPYLYAVMKETLRLHPALPLLVPHSPSESCVVGGYTIPKRATVFINVWAIHRDPSVWENPLEFDPERFLGSKWDYNGNDLAYFPFGSGRRICAGTAMAERMFMYSLASLVHSFDWKLPDGEDLDMSERFGIVLKKKIPLVAIPTRRLNNDPLYQ